MKQYKIIAEKEGKRKIFVYKKMEEADKKTNELLHAGWTVSVSHWKTPLQDLFPFQQGER